MDYFGDWSRDYEILRSCFAFTKIREQQNPEREGRLTITKELILMNRIIVPEPTKHARPYRYGTSMWAVIQSLDILLGGSPRIGRVEKWGAKN